MMWQPAIVMALLFPLLPARAESPQGMPRVGDTYEIIREVLTVQRGSNGSSSESSDRDMLIARVTGVREDGLELEYALPAKATAEERAATWQLPARVLKPRDGAPQLLNGPELEARVDGWLKKGGMTRAACGHWIFTWNAFRIECDPQSVLGIVGQFDVMPDALGDGGTYRDPGARAAGTLTKTLLPNGAQFAVELPVDPEAVRRARAEADVVVAEIMQKPVALEAALRARAADDISGTIMITFETDPSGFVRQWKRITKLETKKPDGVVESETRTEAVRRRLVSPRRP